MTKDQDAASLIKYQATAASSVLKRHRRSPKFSRASHTCVYLILPSGLANPRSRD
jgi:hypothetical protein